MAESNFQWKDANASAPDKYFLENNDKAQLETKFRQLKKDLEATIKKATGGKRIVKKENRPQILVIVYYTGHGYSVNGQLAVACP